MNEEDVKKLIEEKLELNKDSFEWGAASKDCKAKIYVDLKKMTKKEIEELIDKANSLRDHAQQKEEKE